MREIEKPTVVPIDVGENGYDVLIGRNVIDSAGEELKRLLPNSRFAIVTDQTVAELHLSRLTESLESNGLSFDAVTIEPGEGSKSFSVFEDLCERILATQLGRTDAIIAFGGGVVGDVVGFVASAVRRGINLVQIPTTLLAQVDSSVGGKTGINTGHGKNLIGAFYQPRIVFADTQLLETLSKREFKAGYAEVAKYGLINDSDFFEWLEKNWVAIHSGGKERDEAIARSCKAKAEFVAKDEKEAGDRALLNLGHTFGHALEAATGYDSDRLIHGEGVSIGICLAFAYSESLSICPPDDVKRVKTHFSSVGLPTRIDQIPNEMPSAETLMEHIMQDKKVTHGDLKLILVKGVGLSFIEDKVEPGHVLEFLKGNLQA